MPEHLALEDSVHQPDQHAERYHHHEGHPDRLPAAEHPVSHHDQHSEERLVGLEEIEHVSLPSPKVRKRRAVRGSRGKNRSSLCPLEEKLSKKTCYLISLIPPIT